MSELPKGWFNSELCDVAEVVSGNAFKSKDFVENGIPVVKISNVQSGEYIEKNQEYLPESFNNKDNSRFIVTYNDLLIALTRPIVSNKLKVCTYPNKSQVGLLNQRVARLDVNEGFSKRFLHYYLSSKEFRESVQASMSETLQPNLSPKSLSKINIACPPLAEQQRIVEKLDEVLAQVDIIKARLDGIPDLLKRFRQSILASAVSGKLTEEWRGVTGSYKTVLVNDICDMAFDGPFGSKLKSNDYTQIGCRVVRLENIGHLHFLESKKTYVSESKFDSLPKNHLVEGDILFSSFVDEEIRVCLFPGLETGTINKADCFCLRVNSEIALNKYVCYLLASLPTYQKIKKAVHGATRPRINLRFLKNFELELPDLAEQKEIVRLVDQYFAFADTIEAQVKKAQARVDNLTQSILAKAFRGELVAQDPNDEPADKLLERIVEAHKEAEALAKAAKKARSTKSPAKKRAAKSA